MSTIPESPPQLPPAGRRSGCVTAIMIVGGVVLLLPGLCSLVFIFAGSGDNPLAAAGLIVGALGVGLVWWAITRRKR